MESLQEQLLKAGLVDKNRANKAKKDKQKQSKVARHSGAKPVRKESTAAHREQEKRVERDRELNQQKQKQAEQKAAYAQIKQLIELNRIDTGQGEIAYSFIYRDKIKKIYVTDTIKQQLGAGRLAIVRLVLKSERLFEIVPAGVAEKIAQRDENSVVHLNPAVDKLETEDDPYADYQIPDDLTW
jgi:uncharacterized protein YaiL (DUF2058 family)